MRYQNLSFMAHKIICLLIICCFISGCSQKEVQLSYTENFLPVIPQPTSVQFNKAVLQLNQPITIVTSSSEAKSIASLLKDYLDSKNISSSIGSDKESRTIEFIQVPHDSMNAEGYRLTIN